MDDPNITIEEYIKLEEGKARKHGKVFNWETAKYGKIWLSLLNDDEIDFRISFDDSDDEDYTVIYDKNSFSYKIISVDDLETNLKNDNDKVNIPSFPSPEPTVNYFSDFDFLKDFEKEFTAIAYNDALTSKLDFLTEPTMNPQIIIHKDNDDDKVDIEHSLGDLFVKPLPDVINTDVGAYAHGFNTTAGNPVKKILLKLNLSDHRLFKDGGGVKEFQRSFRHSDTERLSRSDEVLKLKNFKKDATLKLFKSTNQERYEHVGLEVTSSQDGQGHKMAKKRLCLVDDLKVFKITFKTS
ncbi:hypothetical protein Tco_1053502 [Tanacetum coccineum]|uniref:Uncharacterized protein n=1 Tax=Tanacetum coccineum TaxID=301880 RepID=A0ABQ5GU47_9ASTR